MVKIGIETVDLTLHNIDRLKKELTGVQMGLEMLYTKNNSLDELDIEHGGGSPEDQTEYQRLKKAQLAIVTEINKRHMLSQLI